MSGENVARTLRRAWIALIGLPVSGPAWGLRITLNPGSFQSESLPIVGETAVQQLPVGLPETDTASATRATPGTPDGSPRWLLRRYDP